MFKLIGLDCFAKGVPERLDALTKKTHFVRVSLPNSQI